MQPSGRQATLCRIEAGGSPVIGFRLATAEPPAFVPHPASFSRDSPSCQCSSVSPRFSQASCGSGMVRSIS